MSETLKIPKQFWTQNPLLEMSAAQMAYFSMQFFSAEEIEKEIYEVAAIRIAPERQAKIDAERVEITALDSGTDIVKFMRREHDVVNRNTLCKKALEMQEDVMPLILRRFQTSAQTVFIESVALIFAHCDAVYAHKLREIYSNIRDPYAVAMASVALAFRGDKDAVPLLLQKYERLQQEYPEEDYDQGPLLALYCLYDKV